MTMTDSTHSDLMRLMHQAYELCRQLQQCYTEVTEDISDIDDNKIVLFVDSREKVIEELIAVEYRIDLLLDEVEGSTAGQSLPPEAEGIRQSIRNMLHDISARDLEIMKIISSKMQTYKTETLKARNKKNLSAYIGQTTMHQTRSHINLLK